MVPRYLTRVKPIGALLWLVSGDMGKAHMHLPRSHKEAVDFDRAFWRRAVNRTMGFKEADST